MDFDVDHELYATPDQTLRLSEIKNKKVVLAFYPADWSLVCSDQMALYNEMLSFFQKHNAVLIGIWDEDSLSAYIANSIDVLTARKRNQQQQG